MPSNPQNWCFERSQRITAVTNWLIDHAYRQQHLVAKGAGVSINTVRNLMRKEPSPRVSMSAISKLERYIEQQANQQFSPAVAKIGTE